MIHFSEFWTQPHLHQCEFGDEAIQTRLQSRLCSQLVW